MDNGVRKPMSLVKRLTLSYSVAFCALIGLSFYLLYFAMVSVVDRGIESDLKEDIVEFSELLEQDGVSAVMMEMDKEALNESDSTFLLLVNSRLEVVHSTPLELWSEFNPDLQLLNKLSVNQSDELTISRDFEQNEKHAWVVYGALTTNYFLIVGESTDERDELLEVLLWTMLAVMFLSFPIAMMLVFWLSRRSIGGIRLVSSSAMNLKRGNLNSRVNAVNQAEEVQYLADAFDSMADRIQQLISDMKDMTDNIAHDLRSPIGRIRLLSESTMTNPGAEVEVERHANQIVNECDRLIEMINISLDVSETEAGISVGRESQFDIVEVVDDACDLYDALAEDKQLKISKLLIEPCFVNADLHSIQRMVANILDNAVKYSNELGLITVSMKVENSSVFIDICNTGIIIKEADYLRIFNRYYRVDPSRSCDGRGLGLSYARAVARLHAGDVTATSDTVNRTSTFTIMLPCASEAKLTHNSESSSFNHV